MKDLDTFQFTHDLIKPIRQLILDESWKFKIDVAKLGGSITEDEAAALGHNIASLVKVGMTKDKLMRIIAEEVALLAMTTRSPLDEFIDAVKQGKIQHCVHDEWYDCNLENLTVGYLIRARNFRIVDKNTPADNK
jgi:hypothetical protein